ncbi:JmjC domain-containing protein [Myxococcus stipitatus DSM 14675]|uniref:JmjC domain-containing protein n=1 Tax=Myxococcus stipitatus (strain DSM 14675 / JCM 12634 / Mx s8) TaxID=1278073 RepID=L7UBJ8_MYXSD|nr:hypothetical protein [Myxococcus stipitatus]AGC44927.1 JmjC domain-containing protein [Myxococcus stipitatus DSM 14675]
MHDASTRHPLAPEWRRWVVENLLRGAEAEDLVSVLARAGVDEALARSAIHAEMEDPCFQGAARAVAMQRKLEGLLDLYGDLHRQSQSHPHITRHEALTPRDFFEHHYFQNLPVVCRATVVEDAVLQTALERLGTATRAAWDERLPLAPPRGIVAWPSPVGLWRDAAGTELPLTPSRRNTLVCQVRGRALFVLVPAYALHRVRDAAAVPEGVLHWDVELSPGELLLLPVGWWFAFRSPEGGVAVTFDAFAAPEPNVMWTPRPESREPTPPPRPRAAGGAAAPALAGRESPARD